MTPRLVHDLDGRTYACPWCDRAGNVYERVRDYGVKNPQDTYLCEKCGGTFDIPVERGNEIDREAIGRKGGNTTHRHRVFGGRQKPEIVADGGES